MKSLLKNKKIEKKKENIKMVANSFIKFEEFERFNYNKQTKREDIPVYNDLFIAKGLKVIVASARKGHSIITIPGDNIRHEVKGSPDAIVTKLDFENEYYMSPKAQPKKINTPKK